MKFERNVGPADRIIRVLSGVAIAAALVAGAVAAPLAYVPATVSAILILTGIVGFCPIYALLKISTRRAERA